MRVLTATRNANWPHDPTWPPKTGWGAPWTVIPDYELHLGVVGCYQWAYELYTDPVLAYIHDDVVIRDADWRTTVMREFDDPAVGLVGFGGAIRHGASDLYRTPYRLEQLARSGYVSNTDDAEQHGQRISTPCDVAVLDGFALIVRREVLRRAGGWHPEDWPPHHVYDYVISAMARRYGYRIRVVPVRCLHLGGRTSTTAEYQQWAARTRWGSDAEMHTEGHRLFYERFQDVLPYEVPSQDLQRCNPQ